MRLNNGFEIPQIGVGTWTLRGETARQNVRLALRQGKVRSIGVSNFNRHHLDDLLSYAEILPAVNQIEVHPLMTQEENIAYNHSLGIQVEA